MFRQFLEALADATPAQCEVCRAWPARPLCEACEARFAAPRARCRYCALALPDGVQACGLCVRQALLDDCHAAVSYGYPWSGLIHRFKFSGQPGWAAGFARLLLRSTSVRECIAAADRLVPMPLSPARLARRGFNQAHELARRLSPGKADPRLAVRLRDTPPQAGLDRAARRANVRQAFALDPSRAHETRGQRIVLVDDVMTTGASLQALAAVFRAAGAAHVAAIVVARTEDA